MRPKGCWVIPLLAIVCLAACEVEPNRPVEVAERPACGPVRAESGWTAGAGALAEVGAYGRFVGEELGDVWGLGTTPSGRLLVWDAGRTRVLQLEPDLANSVAHGREGTGPGEFVYQRVVHGDWLAVGDSSFVLLGLGTGVVSEFRFDGTFLRNPTRTPPFPVPIRRIAIWAGNILYAVDSVDPKTGSRALETWRLEPQAPHTLIRRDSIAPLPKWRGRPVHNLPGQADPSWAVVANCLFVSDGSADRVIRVGLVDGIVDTLLLPPMAPPPPTDEDLKNTEEMWRSARALGMAPAGIESTLPTAVARWRGMISDPDGFLWIQPWRPASYEGVPGTVFVVNPVTGAIREVVVPRFPGAFLPSGAVVSLTNEGPGAAPVIVKYAPSPKATR